MNKTGKIYKNGGLGVPGAIFGGFGAPGRHSKVGTRSQVALGHQQRNSKVVFFGGNGRPKGRFWTPVGGQGGSKIALFGKKST